MNRGVYDPWMRTLSRCCKSKFDKNISRNLHGVIRRGKKLLQVEVSKVGTMWRTSRKKPASFVLYPVLKPSDWVKCSLSRGGHHFLGGKDLDHAVEFGETLQLFWSRFKDTDPNFPFFGDFPESAWKSAIPLALHGDEGRGRLKRPVLVLSAQTIIPIHDFKSNMQGLLCSIHV